MNSKSGCMIMLRILSYAAHQFLRGNGEQFVMLLMEHGLGVHRSTPDLFEIDEEFAVKALNQAN